LISWLPPHFGGSVQQGDRPDDAVGQAQVGVGLTVTGHGLHTRPDRDQRGRQDASQPAVRLAGGQPLRSVDGGDFGPSGAVDGDGRAAAGGPERDYGGTLLIGGIGGGRVGIEFGRDQIGEAQTGRTGSGRVGQHIQQPVGEDPAARMDQQHQISLPG
jgi:hypothetical protein